MLLMYLGTFPVNQSIERVMTTSLRISSCIVSLLLSFMIALDVRHGADCLRLARLQGRVGSRQ